MNNKGFLNILLAGIVIIALAGAGYWYWQNGQENSDASKDTPTPTEVISQAPTATATPTPYPTPDSTSGWQTYIDEEFGFSFEYPGWLWSEPQIENSINVLEGTSTEHLPLSSNPQSGNNDDSMADEGQYVSISIDRVLYDMETVEEWMNYVQNAEENKTSIGCCRVTNVSTRVVDDEIRWLRYEARPGSTDWPLYFAYYIFPNYNRNYVINVWASQQSADSQIFQRIINTLNFN